MYAGIVENNNLIIKFVAPISVKSNQPVFVSDTLALRRQTVSHNAQRWEIQAQLEPSNSSADFLVHSVVNGYNTTITIRMPQVYRLQKDDETTATSCVTTGVAAVNSSLVPVSILKGTDNAILKKGEFIQFTGHDKVYLVTEDAVTGNVKIFPALRAQVNSDTAVLFGENVKLRAKYDTDTMLGITYKDGILSDPGSITFIEAL